MKRAFAVMFAIAFVVMVAGATLAAHEVTYKGTVTSVEPGKVSKLKIKVVDEKTKKVSEMAFEFDDHTKVLRGDVVVKYADVKIAKDETISVTINHDDNETYAEVIRLPAAKK